VYAFQHPPSAIATDARQHDGIVVIFDIETNGVARKLRGHTRQVQSLSWSMNDRYLLSAGQDWKVVLWDLKDGSRVRTVRFEAAIFIAELHPKNQSVSSSGMLATSNVCPAWSLWPRSSKTSQSSSTSPPKSQ
jgi:WD40 repeat protein